MAPTYRNCAILITLALFAQVGCVSRGELVQRRYEITQQASLPAPSGPVASGTMTPAGKVSAQGGVQVTYVETASEKQDRNNLGVLYMNKTMQGRISYGLGQRLELSLAGSYGNTQLATASSSVAPNDDPLLVAHAIWGGLHSRVLAFGDKYNGLAFFGGVMVGRVPFNRHVKTTTTRMDRNGQNPRVTVEDTYENSAEVHAIAQGGAQVFVSPLPWITINGGLMAQSHPRFWAKRYAGEACEDNGWHEICSGDTPETMEPYNTITIGSLFVGGSLFAEGPFSIHGQLFVHALSHEIIRQTTPVGGDLQLRVTF